jgi:hypothetical protein
MIDLETNHLIININRDKWIASLGTEINKNWIELITATKIIV